MAKIRWISALFDRFGQAAAGADEDSADVVHPFCLSGVGESSRFARIRIRREFALTASADPSTSVVIKICELFGHIVWSPAFRRLLS